VAWKQVAPFSDAQVAATQSLVFWRGTTLPSSKLPNFRAAAVRARTAGNRCLIADIGDSTHCGYDGGYVDKSSQSLVRLLANVLRERGVYANHDSFIGSQNVESTGATPFTYDKRLTATGSMTTLSLNTIGKFSFYLPSGAAGTLVFAPSASYNTIEFFYATASGAGNGSVAVSNGGATLGDYDSNVAASITRQVITVTESRTPITITRGANAGSIFPLGCIVRNTNRAEICFVNTAWNGSVVADFSDPGAFAYTHAQAYSVLQADLTILGCQINDWRAGTLLATYKNNSRTVINTARTTGDVLLYTGIPSAGSEAAIATQQAYVQTYLDLQDEYASGVGLIDMNAFVGSYAAWSGNYYVDAVHGNTRGYGWLAGPIASVLLAAALT
jgi:hypothetical protein